MQYRYFMIYKPYGMLSQFSAEVPGQMTLASIEPALPHNVYPVGRLDKDSEGLLLLSDDPALNHRLLDPRFRHSRTYWVQVEGIPAADALRQLQLGVRIKTEKGPYHTLPAEAKRMDDVLQVPERHPPVRFRSAIPTSWIELTLTEGKNRQVRRMCAAVGYPVLRLIRVRIGQLELRAMEPGQVRELDKEELFRLLGIDNNEKGKKREAVRSGKSPKPPKGNAGK